ncbi:hypothetical protein TWF569_001379 [Orbilia oligospora]|nr:hypothetical protein TWF706_001063 [Orbilia oligospora]KAF3153774.1 hypothetical protein TWF569_001379 [Orbilia oligospora]
MMKKFLNLLRPSSAPKPDPEPEDSWSDPDWDLTKNPTSSNTAYQAPEFIHPPPPTNKPLPILPAEIHLHILEHTDWTDHPTLSRVCKLWRHFLKTSPTILESHYENYNRFYEESWQSSILKNRPRPRVHRIVEYLETFVRGRSGNFYPGRIHLKDPRDRWGGHWGSTNHPPTLSSTRWINPKCRLIEPFDYSFFKDEPLVRYTEGEGDKINISVTETSYTTENGNQAYNSFSKLPEISENKTVGDYLHEIVSLVNFEDALIEYYSPPRAGNCANVVWVSVHSTLMTAVGLRFNLKGVYYEIAKDSFVY